MIIDLGPVATKHGAECSRAARELNNARNQTGGRTLLTTRNFMVVWTALSIVWIVGALDNIYQKVNEQAAMSVDVERDLDQGMTQASCTNGCQTSLQTAAASSRFDIASTYLQFGSVEMGEWVFGPPAALLLIGLGALSVRRRRRKFQINPY